MRRGILGEDFLGDWAAMGGKGEKKARQKIKENFIRRGKARGKFEMRPL